MNRIQESGCASSRTGVSLIETLVALSLLSAVVALLLPAVQRVRESSRRITCRNHLKQIGLAVNQYESQYRYYPIGVPPAVLKNGEGAVYEYSVTARILPWLDQVPLSKRINYSRQLAATGIFNRSVVEEFAADSVPVLLCPSDPLATGSRCSYSYSTGVSPRIVYGLTLEGAFGIVALRTADFRDGLSHTAGMSEKLVGDAAFESRRHLLWIPKQAESEWHLPDPVSRLCASLLQVGQEGTYPLGVHWIQNPGNLYNHVLLPNSPVIGCAFAHYWPPIGSLPPRSEHASPEPSIFPQQNFVNLPKNEILPRFPGY